MNSGTRRGSGAAFLRVRNCGSGGFAERLLDMTNVRIGVLSLAASSIVKGLENAIAVVMEELGYLGPQHRFGSAAGKIL